MNHAQERVENRVRWPWTDVRPIDAQEQDVVRLSGNVNVERSLEIRKVLLEAVAGKRNVFVDLSKVAYIDSAGIACLVEALQMARDHGADLGLLSVSRRIVWLRRFNNVPDLLAFQSDSIGLKGGGCTQWICMAAFAAPAMSRG